MTCVESVTKILIADPVPGATIAETAFTLPSLELIVDAVGRGSPAGHTVRNPSPFGPIGTTVTFRAYAWAFAGIPQALSGTTKSRE